MAQNERDKALRQIAEITSVIKASNKLMFPSRSILALGIGVLFIPLIEIPTQSLTFGVNFGQNHFVVLALIHVVFYFFYFNIIRLSTMKIWNEAPLTTGHPLIQRSLSLEKPIIVAIAGTIMVLVPIGEGYLAYPFVYIFLGILFNLYGRLSTKLVFYISWSYIFFGLIYMALSIYKNDDMWIPFNTYLGATLIVMGYSALKEKKVEG